MAPGIIAGLQREKLDYGCTRSCPVTACFPLAITLNQLICGPLRALRKQPETVAASELAAPAPAPATPPEPRALPPGRLGSALAVLDSLVPEPPKPVKAPPAKRSRQAAPAAGEGAPANDGPAGNACVALRACRGARDSAAAVGCGRDAGRRSSDVGHSGAAGSGAHRREQESVAWGGVYTYGQSVYSAEAGGAGCCWSVRELVQSVATQGDRVRWSQVAECPVPSPLCKLQAECVAVGIRRRH